jgi:hypothetical protein
MRPHDTKPTCGAQDAQQYAQQNVQQYAQQYAQLPTCDIQPSRRSHMRASMRNMRSNVRKRKSLDVAVKG